MGKLHAVLSVERPLAKRAHDAQEEARDTFKNKRQHFSGYTKFYEPFNEDEAHERGLKEERSIVTTARAKLQFALNEMVPMLDCKLQKEEANQRARADVILGGEIFLENLPATELLGLESDLNEIRKTINSVPTLPPGTNWARNDQDEPDILTSVTETARTKKELKTVRVFEPTATQPGQYEKWTADIEVGKYIVHTKNGMMSPGEKATLLARLDDLLIAVKSARQRANDVEAGNGKCGDKIVNFIMNGNIN